MNIEKLKTEYPDLEKELHPFKNKNIHLEDIDFDDSQRLWWLCPKGHAYSATIPQRIKKKENICPYCKILIPGKNDLQTCNPSVSAEWDYQKNGRLTPSNITANSSIRVWWRCPQGHSYQASPNNRMTHGCPYCKKKKILSGYNDLKTKRPEIAEEWDTEKNGNLLPSQVFPGSHQKVWWKCSYGHSYQARINARTTPHGSGCPVCGKLMVKDEHLSFQFCYPEESKEWDTEKNAPFLPSHIYSHSSKIFWWKCSQGHSYQKAANLRAIGQGCPYCSGRKAIPGKTDLATLHPEIAEEWNYQKNKGLLPSMVKSKSRPKVWWKCPKGHEYQALIKNRTAGSGCPYCSGRKK